MNTRAKRRGPSQSTPEEELDHDDPIAAVKQLAHQVELHKQEVDARMSTMEIAHGKLAKDQLAMKKEIKAVSSSQKIMAVDIKDTKNSLEIILMAMGLGNVKHPDPALLKRRPVALMSQWEALWKGASAVVGGIVTLFFAIKLIRSVGPGVIDFFVNEWHVIDKMIMA
jgi:hypothetical protein